MTIGMGILWGGLLGTPVLAYLAHRFGRPQHHKLLPLSFAVLAVVALAWAVGLRFTSPLANLMALALAYTAYAFLAWESWGIGDKHIGLRMILKFVTALPIVFGYFMATFGFPLPYSYRSVWMTVISTLKFWNRVLDAKFAHNQAARHGAPRSSPCTAN